MPKAISQSPAELPGDLAGQGQGRSALGRTGAAELSGPPDRVRSFLFEQLDIRGAWVQLGGAWREMAAGRDYPEPALELLGQLAG